MTIDDRDAIQRQGRPAESAASLAWARSGYDARRRQSPLSGFLLRKTVLRTLARMAILLGLDFVGVCAALMTANVIKRALGTPAFSWHLAWRNTDDALAFAYLLTVLAFARLDLYSDRPRRPGTSKVVVGLFQAMILGVILSLATGNHFSSYFIFYGSLGFGILYIGGLRELYTQVTGGLLEQVGYRRRAVLVGTGKHIRPVAEALGGGQRNRIDVLGYISLSEEPQPGLHSLGELGELPEVLRSGAVDEVIIADPDFPQDQALNLVEVCHSHRVTVHIAPSTMEILAERAEFMPGESVPLFTLRPPVLDGYQFAVKRTFDLVAAVLGLLFMSPLMLACAAAVKLTSRGPVLYRSIRPGIGGHAFACLKFRTMRADIDLTDEQLEALNESSGALFKIRDDPRVTRAGRVLRRYSLDELPQLFNVVRGDMSLVGPRPLPMRDYALLEDWHKKRYLVLPGVTGLWQVSGRSDLDFDDLVRLDFLYLERWSVFLDLSILFKTLPAVVSRRGAF